jgi:hypothetical protein
MKDRRYLSYRLENTIEMPALQRQQKANPVNIELKNKQLHCYFCMRSFYVDYLFSRDADFATRGMYLFLTYFTYEGYSVLQGGNVGFLRWCH